MVQVGGGGEGGARGKDSLITMKTMSFEAVFFFAFEAYNALCVYIGAA